MEKVYRLDTSELNDTIDEVYGSGLRFDYSKITGDDFEKIKQSILETLDNYHLEDRVEMLRDEEEITCLPDDVKFIFDKLFADKDLTIYGHGGNAEAIMASGVFNCYYADLSSHFLPLNKTNESLSKLNNWPHRDYSKIAIMALNSTEYNPIYKKNEGLSEYDTNRYSISTEYFVGYYDGELKKFFLNPSFKREHSYNPENSLYENSDSFSGHTYHNISDKLVNEYMMIIFNILTVLTLANTRNLGEHGYTELRKQIDNYLKQAEDIHSKLTPEYLNKIQLEEMVNTNSNTSDSFTVDFDLSDWDNDWKSPIMEEKNNKTK